MSWENLPTNYTDAVFSGLRKYQQINNGDGTISFQDVTVYQNQENSFFGANDANKMNSAINQIMNNQLMWEDITTLFTGALSDMSYANLSESAYNFQFLAVKPSSGPNILMPVLSDAASVAGSVSIPIAEAYDTYMFGANIADNGNILGDNRNVKITTTLGNPAQTIYSTFTVAAIYGICRISS